MDYIRKLPLLISLSVAIVVGMAGYIQEVPEKENMFRMLIVMIIFYLVGFFIKAAALSIYETLKEKEEQEQREHLENKQQENSKDKKRKGSTKGKVVDIRTKDHSSKDTEEEMFNALPIADFIKKELNQ
ncbi:MAG TPA: hypothetical protein DD738_11255 [Ruminiclostridium sp.]|jgi:Na+/melibiose symporter-like transporter|nr:hypothetical protein [Ruminiclostridium sp.]